MSRLDDIKKWKIEMLAKFGGFSHKYIAANIFDKPSFRVTAKERNAVRGYLSRRKIKLYDWRNGLTVQSQAYAKTQLKPKTVLKIAKGTGKYQKKRAKVA